MWDLPHSKHYSYEQGNNYTEVEEKIFTIFINLEQVWFLNTLIGSDESKTNLALEVFVTLHLNKQHMVLNVSIKNYTSLACITLN
jgi:hypothetical protein